MSWLQYKVKTCCQINPLVLRDDYTCHSTIMLRKPNDDLSHQNNMQSNGWPILVLVFCRVHWHVLPAPRLYAKKDFALIKACWGSKKTLFWFCIGSALRCHTLNLMFCGPCIVIYLCNKNQQDALFYSQFISILRAGLLLIIKRYLCVCIYIAVGMCYAENNGIM